MGSKDVLVKFYEMILAWNGSLGGGDKIDHTFYFTERDSNNHGDIEGFGMVTSCHEPNCKYMPGSVTPRPTPAPTRPDPGTKSFCEDLGCGNHDNTCWCTTLCKHFGNCCDDYDLWCR